MVVDFFKNLVRSRVSGVKAKVKGKAMGAQAKAKAKASAKFNKAVDAPGKKLKGKGKGKGKKDKKGDKEMGLFGKKKKKKKKTVVQQPMDDMGMEEDGGGKTVALNLDDLQTQVKGVVGWVVIMNGDLKGTDFRLYTGKNDIGTVADCAVVLTDGYISSRHASIRYKDNIYTLIDEESTNGTFLNGKQIDKTELIDNDIVRVGKTILKFKALY